MNAALVELGLHEVPAADLQAYIGPPLRGVVGEMLARAGHADADEDAVEAFIDAYRGHYAQAGIALTVLVDGMDDVLRRLRATMTCGVVTSKPQRFARPVVGQVGLTDLLDFVEGPRAATEDEAKEATLRRALADAGDPTAVMIGDRAHDIVAGRTVGVPTIGVLWGIGTRDELTDAKADHLVDRVTDLAPLVEQVVGR